MTQVKASPLFILLSLQVLRAAALSEAKPFFFLLILLGLSETQRDKALSLFYFDRLTLLGGDLRGERSGRLP